MRAFTTVLRVLGALLAAAMAALFVLPMTVRVINIGNIAGLALSVWLFLVCVIPRKRAGKRGFFRFLRIAVNTVCIALLVYGAAVTTAMAIAANAPADSQKTVIVLGAQVRPTGEPSVILRGRINAAEEYLRQNPDSAAVLSGGKGGDEVISEAQCMFNTMTADGIDADRLFMEDKSTTTEENLRYSFALLDSKGKPHDEIVIATDGFHQLRARMIAKHLDSGLKIAPASSFTRPEFIPTYVVREWFALPYQFIKLNFPG